MLEETGIPFVPLGKSLLFQSKEGLICLTLLCWYVCWLLMGRLPPSGPTRRPCGVLISKEGVGHNSAFVSDWLPPRYKPTCAVGPRNLHINGLCWAILGFEDNQLQWGGGGTLTGLSTPPQA